MKILSIIIISFIIVTAYALLKAAIIAEKHAETLRNAKEEK